VKDFSTDPKPIWNCQIVSYAHPPKPNLNMWSWAPPVVIHGRLMVWRRKGMLYRHDFLFYIEKLCWKSTELERDGFRHFLNMLLRWDKIKWKGKKLKNSYTMGIGSSPGVKRPGRGFDHTPPSSAKIKERVELHLYSPSGLSWPVLGWTLLSINPTSRFSSCFLRADAWKSSLITGLEWPREFQEFNVPRLHDNGTG
jgi:hypothetical protein